MTVVPVGPYGAVYVQKETILFIQDHGFYPIHDTDHAFFVTLTEFTERKMDANEEVAAAFANGISQGLVALLFYH